MNRAQAKDTMLELVRVWSSDNKVTVIWPDKDGKPPTGQVPWARVTIKHATGGQSSLSDQNGLQRHTYTGTLYVQLFTPKNGGNLSEMLSDSLLLSLRHFRNDTLWFRDMRAIEVGRDGDFFQVNVLTTFTYDDIR